MTWREKAAPLIASAIAEGKLCGLTGRKLRLFVNNQYPWGPRENHPWKTWCSESRRQLNVCVRLKAKGEQLLFGGSD